MPGSEAAAIMDMDPGVWQRELDLADDDLPVAIISEGSWWRAERTKWRLGYLENVKELAFPDIFWGLWRGRPVLYCCAYGAPRAVEIAHLGGCLGARLAIQIGTCGALKPGLATGDIVVPTSAICKEGIAGIYGAADSAPADPVQVERAADLLRSRDHNVHAGVHLTWTSIFAQTAALARSWRDAGYLSVDMETATVFAVAKYFDMSAVSMLVVWDELLNARSFLDPLPDADMARLNDGNRSVYEAALDLIEAPESAALSSFT